MPGPRPGLVQEAGAREEAHPYELTVRTARARAKSGAKAKEEADSQRE
jgi:hypothetical protein